MKIVEVVWMDSTGHEGWHDPKEDDELLAQQECRSVGYLYSEDERGVVLLMGTGAMGLHLVSQGIPRSAILKMKVLR